MMNYQYPASYPTDAADPMLKIQATPPPILPTLDATDLAIEQTLYQRRVPSSSDATNDIDSLQPLRIAGYNQQSTAYPYPSLHGHSSAPVPIANKRSNNLFNAATKPPQSAQAIIHRNNKLVTPSTPPPPPTKQGNGGNHLSIASVMKKQNEIQSITPQSHANLSNNSASNHSANSSVHTTTTTLIDSVSNGIHSPNQALNVNQQPKHAFIHKLSVPKLNNPLPPQPTESIVIPMDQQNYNALLQQMYPTQPLYPAQQQQHYHHADKYNNYSTATQATSAHYAQEFYYDGNGYPYQSSPHGGAYYANANNYYQCGGKPDYHQQAQSNHYGYPPQQQAYGHYGGQLSPHASDKAIVSVSHSHTSPSTQRQNSNSLNSQQSPENMKVDYLQRCDGTVISPNADPLCVPMLKKQSAIDSEMDAFTAGDDALFGAQMVTIISVNWSTNIPFGTVRMHNSNRIHHVPLMDLQHIASSKQMHKQFGAMNLNNGSSMNQRYRLQGGNGVTAIAQISEATVLRRPAKLTDETLMKLPHLRKHREYIRSIDQNMGPKDYNSFRVSVNSKTGDEEEMEGGGVSTMPSQVKSHNQMVDSNGRTANIQNLHAKACQPTPQDLNAGVSKRGNAGGRGNGNRRGMNACEKGDLFKTELCENWVKKGHCTYGKKCHFAHGREDIRTRWRIENYKTQPCCDPARSDSRLCLFGKRCNYAHPGEPLRRSHHCLYLDEEYTAEIKKDFGNTTPFPFGIYI